MNNNQTPRLMDGFLTTVVAVILAVSVAAFVYTQVVAPAFAKVSTTLDAVNNSVAR